MRGNSVESMGEGVFSGSTALKTVAFQPGCKVAVLPKDTFKGCVGIRSVTLPDGLVEIGESAFENCCVWSRGIPESGLAAISLPASVARIGDNAFVNDGYLLSIDFPRGLESVGRQAFANCKNVQTVTFNGNASNVTFGSNAFYFGDDSHLANVVFMDKKSAVVDRYIYIGFSKYSTYYNVRFYASQQAFDRGEQMGNVLILDDVAVKYWRERRNRLFGAVPSAPLCAVISVRPVMRGLRRRSGRCNPARPHGCR